MEFSKFEDDVEEAIRKAEADGTKTGCNNAGTNCIECPELGHCTQSREFYKMKKRMQSKLKTKDYLSNRKGNTKMNNEVRMGRARRDSYVEVNEDGKVMAMAKGIAENGKVAVSNAKEMVIMAQVGSATLDAVRTALNAMPIPKQIKEVINLDGYGDAILGLALDTLVPTLTDNDQARKAAQYAANMGVIRGSEQFTVIQDTIKMVVESAVTAGAGIVGAIIPDHVVEANEATVEPSDE